MDQTSQEAVRRLISPTLRLWRLAPSITALLYSTIVSRVLRQSLRGKGPKEYLPVPANHEDMAVPGMWSAGHKPLTSLSNNDEYPSQTL